MHERMVVLGIERQQSMQLKLDIYTVYGMPTKTDALGMKRQHPMQLEMDIYSV
uniref:Uncharacterized protein n=1 Tax=Pithovirus LCPAC304 TaxID=2506594 RepID=A0A481Z8S5_9VIRU|nr:MAG: hypothetical protein LCPAC304_01100 [Pithovirus LCPAC304]